MTQEFVTLPREVVEQALKVLEYAANDVLTGRNAATALRAALEQPQVEQKPAGSTSPAPSRISTASEAKYD